MTAKLNRIRRKAYALAAFVSVFALGGSVVLPQFASAGQVSTRFIQLSNSTPGATGVTYSVSFIPTGTTAIGGIVVDFCADTPIIGSTTCTYPAGFTLGASPTMSVPTGVGGTWGTGSSLQGSAAAGQKQVLVATAAAPVSPTGGATPIAFTISGVTNPSTTGSFYARILTFNTAANTTAQYTAAGTTRAASFANMVDYGGAALSTASNISISAIVMETLTFCVSGAAPGPACSGLSAPTVSLGTGTPPTIDSQLVYDNSVSTPTYTQLSTNALTGASVNMKTTATCTGLSRDGGATCLIPGQAVAGPLSAGTAAFGLKVAAGTGGTGTVSPAGSYNNFYMGAGVTGTYGDPIATTGGACSGVNNQLTFAVTANATTPAGIYSTTEQLIATGKF